LTVNQLVVGSIPTAGAKFINKISVLLIWRLPGMGSQAVLGNCRGTNCRYVRTIGTLSVNSQIWDRGSF
jgi:hypothetical protein